MTTPVSSPTDVLPIRLRTQAGQRVSRPSLAELTALVERIGGEADHFLVLEPIPHRPRVFIQVYRDSASDYTVDHRAGGLDQYAAGLAGAEAVARMLCGWAAQTVDWSHGADWSLSYRHPAVEVTPLAPEAERDATVLAHRFLDEGYADFETMAQDISELAEPDAPVTIEQAEALLEPLWLRRIAEQEHWPTVTDVDRVETALSRLAAAGVRARANFTCCVTCGTGGMYEEDPGTDHGYVFFHSQDTQHAITGELYLSFGAYTETPADAEAVGREVVAALTEQGLSTRWDGTVDQRIAVVGLDWRKRLE